MTVSGEDHCARPARRFVTSYFWNGSLWHVDLYAYDWDDAEARCKALGRLRLEGEYAFCIRTPQASASTAGFLVRAYCWLRNWIPVRRK